jgi:hypothetical protein
MKQRTPSPRAVADACLESAWRDNVDDESRLLLELAHDTIGTLILRLASNAKVLEVVEAELAARNSPLFDDDPGLGL